MIYSGKIPKIKQLIVSDPSYKKDVWCRYESTDIDADNWCADIIVDEFHDKYDGYNIDGIEFSVVLRDPNVSVRVKDESIIYPRLYDTNQTVIGMDTACVSIGINDTADKIRNELDSWQPSTCLKTLTDGQFGNVIEGKFLSDKLGFIYISGFLDEDTDYSIKDILDYLSQNLEIENLTPAIMKDQTEIETFLVEADGIYVSLATWFDVDEKFGTHVNDEDGHWVDLEAKYNPQTDEVTCRYLIDTPEEITPHSYTPSIYEKDMIKELIEDYCLKEENRSALEVYELASQESILGGIEQ